MKTFEQHILDISGCSTIEIADNAVSRNTRLNWAREAAKRYATQVAQDALNRAAENARSCVVGSLSSAMREDMEEFIANTQIILP